jgi:hypothetical protein
MNGGIISNNSATGGGDRLYGGGVYSAGDFTMNGGTISGNTSTATGQSGGGGVCVNWGTFTMKGGTISGNIASGGSNCGGGVFVNDENYPANPGTIIMEGGNISGNIAAGSGGGVFFRSHSTFTMSGGSISGNTILSGSGSGVYVQSGVFTMSQSAAVHTGNAVYLDSNRVITLSGTLSANPVANIVPSDATPGIQVLADDTTTPENDITLDNNYKKFWLNGASNAAEEKIDTDGRIKL